MEVINRNPSTREWYENGWLNLAILDPETKQIFIYKNQQLVAYEPLKKELEFISNLNPIFEKSSENLPIFNLN